MPKRKREDESEAETGLAGDNESCNDIPSLLSLADWASDDLCSCGLEAFGAPPPVRAHWDELADGETGPFDAATYLQYVQALETFAQPAYIQRISEAEETAALLKLQLDLEALAQSGKLTKRMLCIGVRWSGGDDVSCDSLLHLLARFPTGRGVCAAAYVEAVSRGKLSRGRISRPAAPARTHASKALHRGCMSEAGDLAR